MRLGDGFGLDGGAVGGRREGLGASGIGGFFDDQVTDLLGIPMEQAVVYITTIGVPAGGTPANDD